MLDASGRLEGTLAWGGPASWLPPSPRKVDCERPLAGLQENVRCKLVPIGQSATITYLHIPNIGTRNFLILRPALRL